MIDSHTHIDPKWNMNDVVSRAKEAGVEAMITMSTDLETCMSAFRWAELNRGYVHPALGVHPNITSEKDIEAAISFIKDNLDQAVALGEVGLDYFYKDLANEEVRHRQREVLEIMLKLAEDHGLPVSVHSRNAVRDVLRLVKRHSLKGVVFHWYDGSLRDLEEILDCGYYVSATPAAEYSRGHRAALELAPLESILVETDSPIYMRRYGRRSEPADLILAVEALARLKDVAVEQVAQVTTRNAEKVFRV